MHEVNNWNFQVGGGEGVRKNPFRGGGMDIFWNYTFQIWSLLKLPETSVHRGNFSLLLSVYFSKNILVSSSYLLLTISQSHPSPAFPALYSITVIIT